MYFYDSINPVSCHVLDTRWHEKFSGSIKCWKFDQMDDYFSRRNVFHGFSYLKVNTRLS